MKILLIEDELKVSAFIKKGLEENEYIITVANTGSEGFSYFNNNYFELIILDINLPDISGYEVCREIRKINTKVPILMLTAYGSLDDKLKGFENGTDDYLLKPFEFNELIARIKALIKRSQTVNFETNFLKIADLEINLNAKSVKRAGVVIGLTAKEFSLLEYMVKNKGIVISRSDIAKKVWDINFDTGTNVIDVYINFLRKKKDKNFNIKLIQTVVGLGYIIKD